MAGWGGVLVAVDEFVLENACEFLGWAWGLVGGGYV